MCYLTVRDGSYAHESTNGYKNNRKKVFQEAFVNSGAVHCGTLDAFGESPGQNTLSYRVGHVEEAAQCTECSVLPLATKCESLSFAGDPQQLPPHATSDLMKVSLMERMSLMAGMKVFRLNVQYRMPETLIRFPNNRFYSGQLQTAGSAEL